MEDPNVISLKMEHVLVVLGFCIGFGLVVCVAIVYFKFKPVRSFKMLNNSSGKKCFSLILWKIHSNTVKMKFQLECPIALLYPLGIHPSNKQILD